MASRPQLPELDCESLAPRRRSLRSCSSVPRPCLARLLLPEGGVGAARHALRDRPEGARLRARHARASSPRPTPSGRRSRPLRHEGRDLRGPDSRAAGRGPRRGALGDASPTSAARSRRSSRSPRARRARRLDHRRAPRPVTDPGRTRRRSAGTRPHELWKANPLADWDDERCWDYIRERGLPYNELHDRGYSSIGCTHCTKPGAGREGRWTGTRQDRVRAPRRPGAEGASDEGAPA